jgi:hypothetical protein
VIAFFSAGKQSADTVLDFTFDWSVRYFAMSPAKLSLAQSTYEMPGVLATLYEESYFATSQDKAEFRGEL